MTCWPLLVPMVGTVTLGVMLGWMRRPFQHDHALPLVVVKTLLHDDLPLVLLAYAFGRTGPVGPTLHRLRQSDTRRIQ